MSLITAMVIEALKAIGKDSVDEKTIKRLKGRLTKPDKEKLLIEARQTTSWNFPIIKKLSKQQKVSKI